jgi:hypothetical protein
LSAADLPAGSGKEPLRSGSTKCIVERNPLAAFCAALVRILKGGSEKISGLVDPDGKTQ